MRRFHQLWPSSSVGFANTLALGCPSCRHQGWPSRLQPSGSRSALRCPSHLQVLDTPAGSNKSHSSPGRCQSQRAHRCSTWPAGSSAGSARSSLCLLDYRSRPDYKACLEGRIGRLGLMRWSRWQAGFRQRPCSAGRRWRWAGHCWNSSAASSWCCCRGAAGCCCSARCCPRCRRASRRWCCDWAGPY